LEARPDRRWPIAIIVGLMIMMIVNFGFIYIAVSGADQVVESYRQERR
jgi:hypothetical protein